MGKLEQAIRFAARQPDEQGRCGACHGQGWFKANVPLEHKLFGKVRLCVCNPQYAQFGGAWFIRFDQ